MEYIKRYVDKYLKNREDSKFGIVIIGVRGCGKTESALQFAKSKFIVDDKSNTKMTLETNPNVVLEGEKPRLIDEWQLQPWIWNKVRHAIDNKKGCYILTGSATPIDDDTMHTGALRFIFLHMRPLSWYERGWSTGKVSLDDIVNNKINNTNLVEIPFEEKLRRLKIGGWPSFINMDDKTTEKLMDGYIQTICKKDIVNVDGINRREGLAKALLMSLSRNIGTLAADTTIVNDIKLFDESMNRTTFYSYYNALQNINIVEDLPAWSTHIRSSATLKKSPKRYFVDPSIAIASLNLSIGKLAKDISYVGFLFENEVIKNLRIYAESIGATLYYFGDTYFTHEDKKPVAKQEDIDVIMVLNDGDWVVFEIKFAFHSDAIDRAAKQIHRMLSRVDFNKVRKPLSLNIITSDGFAYTRKEDGINVIPLCHLRGDLIE